MPDCWWWYSDVPTLPLASSGLAVAASLPGGLRGVDGVADSDAGESSAVRLDVAGEHRVNDGGAPWGRAWMPSRSDSDKVESEWLLNGRCWNKDGFPGLATSSCADPLLREQDDDRASCA